MESEEVTIIRQRFDEHVPVTMITHETIELKDTVFPLQSVSYGRKVAFISSQEYPVEAG
jgi:hypothetical protein